MKNFFDNKIIFADMREIESRFDSWEWLKNKVVLITGAYGMLVSYMTYFLIYLNESFPNANIQILAVGRNMTKMRDRYGIYMDRPYFKVIQDDICEPLYIEEKIDYIIHAASLASPQYYGIDPVGVLRPNVLGTYYLLELARKKACKAFLFFSSGDVYGTLAQIKDVIKEEDCGSVDSMSLRSCYGESKRMGETMCIAYSHQHGVPTKSVRICHTYGPTLDLENDQRMFSEFVANVVRGENIIVKSDGTATRSLCYLADATDAFFRILRDGEAGRAYNMCNNHGHISVRELAGLLVNMHPYKKLEVIMERRGADSAYMESPVKCVTEFNTDKLEALGWKPKYDVTMGFQRTINSFFQNSKEGGI